MELWQRELCESIVRPGQLAERFGIDAGALEAVCDRYPMRIPPYYLALMEGPGDPLWRQAVPDPAELELAEGFCDPLAEDRLSPVPGLIHRYEDRVVLLVSGACALYCRFCTRKRQVGTAAMQCGPHQLDAAIEYIAQTPAVRDVILSGGDPLLLEDDRLEELLRRLHAIEHVEMIRIGTRTPVTLPSRITQALCRMLRRYHPLYLNTHFNHPRELTEEAAGACARLADAGIVLGNQTVLLRGVNDDAQIMRRLNRGLLKMRVRPYYLHQMDLACATAHFRTPVAAGLSIMEALRGPNSGMAIPHYVIDLPGGLGKVELLPEHRRRSGSDLEVRSPGGRWLVYPDLSE